ncbi:hypothetical protein, partial [Rhodococcus koreensis]
MASTTAAGLARRFTDRYWRAVETGLAAVTERMLTLLPVQRAAELTEGPVTIDLDTTDVEVYGRKKDGIAHDHQGQRVGCPHGAKHLGPSWCGPGRYQNGRIGFTPIAEPDPTGSPIG